MSIVFPYNKEPAAKWQPQLCRGRRVRRTMSQRPLFASLLGAALLTGCAANIPREISTPPPGNPTVAAVRADAAAFEGTPVRWGGTIAAVENQADETRLEIVERELDRSGQPRQSDRSDGRFIALIDGFVDPALYAEGREITVAGVVDGELTRKIGNYDYTFPRVQADQYLLWPLRREPDPRDYPPYWYYDPWYPWYPYPYFYPYRHYHRHPVKQQE